MNAATLNELDDLYTRNWIIKRERDCLFADFGLIEVCSNVMFINILPICVRTYSGLGIKWPYFYRHFVKKTANDSTLV